jgi:LPXTG-site transpeptidase (sortase) family protein
MKEVFIFLLIFLIIFVFALIIFNGRFIYAQIKYSFLGAPTLEQETIGKKQGAGDIPKRLVIPLISVDVPVVLVEDNDEYVIQKALEKGVVLYPDSNIILGHSSAYPWYKGEYGSVFSLLNKLKKDDEVFVFSNEKKYAYQVLEKQIKLPKDLSLEQVKDKSTLYLISCWPINTNWKRIVVKVVLR